MGLTRIQFDILEGPATSGQTFSKEGFNQSKKYNPEEIDQALKELIQMGYLEDNNITSSGLNALKPYQAKRAVFIAAGFGKRLIPITLNTPKPLVRVFEVRIIDRLIDACLSAGIEEIYIVRGYLAVQFDQLLYKYPMI